MGKVLITGACGFIGSHLTERLVREGLEVRAMVHYHSNSSWGCLEWIDRHVLREVEVVPGDVRDFHGIQQAMAGADTVFHLAALIAIPYSYANPQSYLDTNVTGTMNVLQAAKHHNVKRVLTTSTSEVYGTAEFIPMSEKHPLKAQSPYAASKIGSDKVAESFHRSFGLPVTIVRPFNTFGPRQSARAVIPTIITQLLSGSPSVRLGALTPTRDLNFVSDTVSGFWRIHQSEQTIGREINIATGTEVSIQDLAQTLIDMINPEARIICGEERLRPVESEVDRLLGDSRVLTKLTGWGPEYSLEEGLAETIRWFREHLGKYKPDLYNI